MQSVMSSSRPWPHRRHGAHHRRVGHRQELVANELYQQSDRRASPLSRSMRPHSLRAAGVRALRLRGGAFTGARGRQGGMFELATPGSSFWTRSDECPSPTGQAAAGLQQRELVRSRRQRVVKLDIRVIASPTRTCGSRCAGRLPGGLYYRLNVVPIALKPCGRQGGSSIWPTICRTLTKNTEKTPILARRHGAAPGVSWPGNIGSWKTWWNASWYTSSGAVINGTGVRRSQPWRSLRRGRAGGSHPQASGSRL